MRSEQAQPIVVGYDESPHADMALRWALDEAGRSGAAVLIVHVRPDSPDDLVPEFLETARAKAEAVYHSVPITAEVRHGHPAAVLCELSATSRMLVIGAPSRGAVADLLAKPVSVAACAHANCPVIIVGRFPDLVDGLPIMVGVDDTPLARPALEFAFAQAAERNVILEIVHAWQPPAPDPYTGGYLRAEDVAEYETAERRFLRDILEPVAAAYPGVRTRVRLISGPAAAILTELAGGAQLIVIGSRGRSGLAGLLLGSVGLHLLHHSPCPVAIVR